LTKAQFFQAMDALLAQVHWRPIPRRPLAGGEGLAYATHAGVLHLPGFGDLPCFQLNTGERFCDAETVIRLLGLDEEET
jgi:hypothetical protein